MPFSLLQPLRDIPLAIVDVETSGASTQWGDRVIEMGIVRVENGKEVARYEQLIDPRRRISAGVTVLTGITQAMCDGQPTFEQALQAFLPLLQGAVVVGHNVRFDLSFLMSEFHRSGKDLVQELGDPPVMDTVRIARRRFGRGGNGLQSLCRRLGYEPPVAHRALADVITTWRVLELMLEPVGGWGMSLCDAIVLQGGPMRITPANARQSVLPLELEEALDQRCQVMMEYLDANQRRTQRIIKPLEIRRFKGETVLIAHCQLRNDRRNFKLERIVSLTRVMDESVPETTREQSIQQTGNAL